MVKHLLARASARHFVRHPAQLVLAVIGVALGVAIMVAVEVANTSAMRAFDLSMSRITGEATHQIIGGPGGIDDVLYTRLRLLGFRNCAPVVEAFGKSGEEIMHVLGIDPFVEAEFRRNLAKTSRADTAALIARADAVLIAGPTARRLGLRVGDTLALQLGPKDAGLKIIGLIEPSEGDSAAIDGLAVVDIATAQELTGMPGRLSWIDLEISHGVDESVTLDKIRGLLPPDAEIVPAQSRAVAMEQMARAFHTNLTAMSLLALVVGLFLIYNTMSFAVIQRRAHFGRLRLIGASRRELLATVLIEGCAIGLTATVIGIAAGVVLGQSLLSLVTRTMSDLYFVVSVTSVHLGPGPIIHGAALGLLGTLLASFAPALEAALIDPRSALQRSMLETRGRRLAPGFALAGALAIALGIAVLAWPARSITAGFAGLFLFILGLALATPLLTAWLSRIADTAVSPSSNLIARLAIRGTGAALSRTGAAIAALMLAVATTMGVGIMIESFRSTVRTWLDTSLQADIYVSAPAFGGRGTARPLDSTFISHLIALPMVRTHSTGRTLAVESLQGITDVFVFQPAPGLTPRYPLRTGDPGEVWSRFGNDDAILISEPLAYHRHLGPGNALELRTDRGPHRFPIAAIYRDYSTSQGEVLMPRPLYERYFGDAGVSGVGLYLKPGASLETALAAVRAAAAADEQSVNIRSNRELREFSLGIFDRTFTVTEVLRLLALVVAMVGVLSALMALQLERAAEAGLLRALGLTPFQTGALALTQTTVAGLMAGLIAVPTGIAMAIALIHVINLRSFGWTLDLSISAVPLLTGVAAAVLAAVLAGIYPAWKMSRTPPAAALRSE